MPDKPTLPSREPRNKRLLLIAYHFPPIQGSTGVARSLAFCRYLHRSSWDVRILTVHPRAYENTTPGNSTAIPDNIGVSRAWCFDTRRSLSIMGKYPILFAIPDRWQSWIASGYFLGRHIQTAWKPDVLMSTYPIPSAHVIGYLLHKRSGIPWVAEFRDPMLQPNYPSDQKLRWAYSKIESRVFSWASQVVVTTDGCNSAYVDRYSDFGAERITTIPNGYDPAAFLPPQNSIQTGKSNRLLFLHSGLLYPHERNPTAFFHAVRSLMSSGLLNAEDIEFRFRGSGHADLFRPTVSKLGIESLVTFLPSVSYIQAIEEMRQADILMLFQADNCNNQIPAKVYEYFYSRKPILGLVDPTGETGMLLRGEGIPYIAKLEDRESIEKTIVKVLSDLEGGNPFVIPSQHLSRYSRENTAKQLSDVLDRCLRGGR